MEIRVCELCHHNQASFYCTSDSAFLCSLCDSKVHHANFLVARHLRQPLCSNCNSFSLSLFSGPQITILHPLCRSCTSDHHSSSDSSTCISTSKNGLHDRPKKIYPSADSKARFVIENWCKKMDLENWKPIVEIATQTLSLCMNRLPMKVAIAAAFWLGLRYSGDKSVHKLRKLEEISGVAAKVIVVTESKLLRGRRGIRRQIMKEGWAESVCVGSHG